MTTTPRTPSDPARAPSPKTAAKPAATKPAATKTPAAKPATAPQATVKAAVARPAAKPGTKPTPKPPAPKSAARPATAKPAAKPPAQIVAEAGILPALGVVADALAIRKKELVERVVAASGAKKKQVKEIVEHTLKVLGDALSRGEELNLPPFGKARVNRSRDNANGEMMIVKVRRGGGGKSAKAAPAPEDDDDDA